MTPKKIKVLEGAQTPTPQHHQLIEEVPRLLGVQQATAQSE